MMPSFQPLIQLPPIFLQVLCLWRWQPHRTWSWAWCPCASGRWPWRGSRCGWEWPLWSLPWRPRSLRCCSPWEQRCRCWRGAPSRWCSKSCHRRWLAQACLLPYQRVLSTQIPEKYKGNDRGWTKHVQSKKITLFALGEGVQSDRQWLFSAAKGRGITKITQLR